ncbi:MAG: tetratricopeptide repeat protein [Pyrinomonadaceae bacterium]
MNVNQCLLFIAIVLILRISVPAFQISGSKNYPSPTPNAPAAQSKEDELEQHLSAAETYQIANDFQNAAVENRAIIGIALQRLGYVALEENQFKEAAQLLNDSLASRENADARTNLALAYLNLGAADAAVAQAQAALNANQNNIQAFQILGKIYYAQGKYSEALKVLERATVLQPSFDAAYLLGLTCLQLKQIDRAKLLFEKMQIALKKNAALHLLFGQAYEETNYPLEAEREYRQALAIDPKQAGAHFYLGYLILQHGGSERLAESGKEFEQELQQNPQDAFSNFFVGVVASSENEHAKAARFLQEAIRLNPQIGPAYLFLGQSQIELGDNAAAEKNLRRAIELTSDASKNSYQIRRAHFLLGRLLIKSGRKEEGEKELATARELQGQLVESAREEISKVLGQVISSTKAVGAKNISAAAPAKKANLSAAEIQKLNTAKSQLSEILAQAYDNLGVIAVQQNQIEESLADFAAASKWKPDFPGLDRNWGIISFRANLFEQAIAPLSRHVKSHPDDLLTRRMLAVSYYFTKNFKQMVETLKPVAATVSDDPELAYFYGISLVQLQRQPEAAAVFAQLAERSQQSAQADFYAAQGFVLVGDLERAVKEFRRVAELDKTMPQVHYNTGQSLIRLNHLAEAEQEFRAELQLDPGNVLAKYHLAYTLLEQKSKTKEALNLLREAIVARPDYADARYQLGKALIDKGEFGEAVSQLETAAQNDPKKDYIHYQLSIAYRRAARPADAERELKLYKELKAASRSETPAGMGTKSNAP